MDTSWNQHWPISALTFNRTGDRLFAANRIETAIYTWPDLTVEKVRPHTTHSFACHPEGLLVARGMKATVELYSELSKKRRATCRTAAADGVPSMVWVDDNLVVAARGRGRAVVYDLTGQRLAQLKSTGSSASAVACNGEHIAVGGTTLRLYDANTLERVTDGDAFDGSLALAVDGNRWVAGAPGGGVRWFDAAGAQVDAVTTDLRDVRFVFPTPDHVWVTGADGVGRVERATGRFERLYDTFGNTPPPGEAFGVTQHPMEPLLVLGGDREPRFFDVAADRLRPRSSAAES